MTGLKQLRRDKNLTQLQIAQFVHTLPSAVAQWELCSRYPTLGQIIKLCRVLDCTPVQLFEGCADSRDIPFFDLENPPAIVQLPQGYISHPCHFALSLPYSLSERVQAGDTCYFELCDDAKSGDIVVCTDSSCNCSITVCRTDTANIAAVCRLLVTSM